MAEWRFLRGWSEEELADRLERLEKLQRNFTPAFRMMTPDRGWNRYHSEAVIAQEPPGPPAPEGAFERARDAIANYQFSDPRIVEGYFDPDTPLRKRRMLLQMKVMGLRYLAGVAVCAIRSASSADETVFGYRYDSLEGHIETGAEWFLLTKNHRNGEVWFHIQAIWRPGDFPNWWSRLGFHLLARRYQRAWHRLAYLRLREILGSRGLRPVPGAGEILRVGPELPNPGVWEIG